MIKDAIANLARSEAATAFFRQCRSRLRLEAIINRALQFLFAPDVSFRCLDGSVPKQDPDLFEFAAAIMAESGTGATKVVGRQIDYAGRPSASLDRIPDHVRGHASLLSPSHFRNSSEYTSLANPRTREPCIQQLLGPRRHRHCSQPSSLTDQIDDDPTSLPDLQLLQSQSDDFRTP
jgi:hypothetical protein